MGKSEGQDQWARQDEGVQIIDLGADQGDEPSPQRADEPANPIRKWIVVAGLAAAVLLGGFASLTIAGRSSLRAWRMSLVFCL